MPLVTLRNISIRFGAEAILDQANLIIESNARHGLVGRNGAGKSTLLKLIAGEMAPDGGELIRQQGAVIGHLMQEVPQDLYIDVRSIIALGDLSRGPLLARFYGGETESEQLQLQLNQSDAWALDQTIKELCSKFEIDASARFEHLSGGMKRRVLMARALVQNPDLLLLDEPTNHLDIDSIVWLEKLLLGLDVALVVVSHDRSFIDNLCDRIIELDRGSLSSWPGNYRKYLDDKASAMQQEQRHNAKFDRKLAREEAWIRQGIQARRTRNEGRVRALQKMREQRRQRRNPQDTANIGLNEAAKSGKVVVEAKDLSFRYGDSTIIEQFSCRILRGDKVGIIGPNGCGKSTLVKLLTGELQPDQGSVKMGTNLEIAYLDQHRTAIRDELSVQDNVSGSTQLTINGQSKHIISYLQDFLFSPDRARAPAAKLSGGERNRLVLAKLFTLPFNFLILDEPTNDLDFETLELLEQLLLDYSATLLLVSHDRTFLDNIVTSTIAFEGNGEVNEYVGGYEDWLRQRKKVTRNAVTNRQSKTKPEKISTKLSYKLQRELDALPAEITRLELRIEALQQAMTEPQFYQQDTESIAQQGNALKDLQHKLELAFARWEELES